MPQPDSLVPDEQSAQLVSEFVVRDLDQTLACLLALGFEIQRRTGTFAVLRWKEALLFLAQDAAAVVEKRWANVRVIVPDVDALWRKAAEMKAPVVNPIGDRPYGLRDFVILTPGGVEIRFAQVL